jgi:hypothetical protein
MPTVTGIIPCGRKTLVPMHRCFHVGRVPSSSPACSSPCRLAGRTRSQPARRSGYRADEVAGNLIWPEQTGRAERLRAAVRIARADPPRLLQSDLRDGIARLAAEATKDATLVVFHTAVLAYLSSETDRTAFATSVSSLCDYWMSNEGPRVLSSVAARAPAQSPRDRFILAVNGAPVAWTDPHGAAVEWIGEQSRAE